MSQRMQGGGAMAAMAASGQPAEEEVGQADPAASQPEGGAAIDPRMIEAIQLVTARAQEVLVKLAPDLDAALRADPVRGAVTFGTRALRGVAQAAEQAGRPLPFEVLLNAGIAIIQVIGTVANDKGYLDDEDIAPFLKEAFQQSVREYARMDMQEGRLKPRDVNNVMLAMSGQKETA